MIAEVRGQIAEVKSNSDSRRPTFAGFNLRNLTSYLCPRFDLCNLTFDL